MNKFYSLITIFLLSIKILYSQDFQLINIIHPSDGASSDQFGTAVAISDNFIVVGSKDDDDNGSASGSAYIWGYDGTNWNFIQKLLPSDVTTSNFFGLSVAVQGNHLVIGAPGVGEYNGAIYTYFYNGTNWTGPTKITGSTAYDFLGSSIDIDGDYMIVGGQYGNNYIGAAYIYHYQTGAWVLEDILTPSDGLSEDEFGTSVSLSGDFAIVGSPNLNKAYLYKRNGTDWNTDETILTLSGTNAGYSVGISGQYAVIGNNGVGKVFVYKYDGTSWNSMQTITYGTTHFGSSVSISGNKIIVGDWSGDSEKGKAYIYYLSGSTWTQQALSNTGITALGRLGVSVNISGSNAIAGASYDDPVAAESGSAAIYSAPPPPEPEINSHPQNIAICEGSNATFSINALNVTSHQWRKNGVNLSNGGNISGVNTNTLHINNVTLSDADIYDCEVSDGNITINSDDATLTVSEFIESFAGENQEICENSYFLTANNPSPGTGTWSISDGYGDFDGLNSNTTSVTNLSMGITNIFRWTVVNGQCSDFSYVEIITSLPVEIITHPQNQTVCENSDIILSVEDNYGISYIWKKGTETIIDNENISGSNTSQLNISTVIIEDAGEYFCVIANSCGTITSNSATLTVSELILAITEPDKIVCENQAVLVANEPTPGSGFWTVISGNGIVTYSNYYATTISNLDYGENIFLWTITNGACISSDEIIVDYRENLEITAQPQDLVFLEEGSTAVFQITNTSEATSFQWRKNETNLTDESNISGANTSELTISNVTSDDEGNYDCVVTGYCNEEISSVAVLSLYTLINDLSEFGLKIYPNPTDGIFYIESLKPVDMLITDISGKIILEKNILVYEQIDISSYKSGIYLICFKLDNDLFVYKLFR